MPRLKVAHDNAAVILQHHKTLRKTAATAAKTVSPCKDFQNALIAAKTQSHNITQDLLQTAAAILVYGRVENPPQLMTEAEKSLFDQIKAEWQ